MNLTQLRRQAALMHQAPRCSARSKSTGRPCLAPAVRGESVCHQAMVPAAVPLPASATACTGMAAGPSRRRLSGVISRACCELHATVWRQSMRSGQRVYSYPNALTRAAPMQASSPNVCLRARKGLVGGAALQPFGGETRPFPHAPRSGQHTDAARTDSGIVAAEHNPAVN